MCWASVLKAASIPLTATARFASNPPCQQLRYACSPPLSPSPLSPLSSSSLCVHCETPQKLSAGRTDLSSIQYNTLPLLWLTIHGTLIWGINEKQESNLLNSFPSLISRNHENCFRSKLVKKSFVQVCISNLWICSECSKYSTLRANLNKVSVKKTTTAWKDITHISKIMAVCELLEIQAHSKLFLDLNILCTVSGTLTTNPKIRVCKLGQMISWLILIFDIRDGKLFIIWIFSGFLLPIFEKGKERRKRLMIAGQRKRKS